MGEAAHDQTVQNGLAEAVGYTQQNPYGQQIAQTDTLNISTRGYFVSNMRQMLSQIYCEIGLVETIVDLPVEDGLRGGVDIVSSQLDPDQIQDLKADMEQSGDLEIYAQGEKWKRLFGGAGILILTDQDPTTPLDIDAIKEGDAIEFKAIDMWELYSNLDGVQGDDRVTTTLDDSKRLKPASECYQYYGMKVHKTRVLVMKGKEAPSFLRPRLRGWGLSVVETLVRSVNQYLKTNSLAFEIMDEFKIDYYKIKGLAATLSSQGGTQKLQQRIAVSNYQKNYQNAVVMDAEDEFSQKELAFSGVAEMMREIRMQVAADMRMPITKLFGISATGFSSGEDDIENYNAMIESTIREKAKYRIIKMIQLRCQAKFGMVPDDLKIDFKPLRILSSEQEENVKTQKFSRITTAAQSGHISGQEYKDAVNKDNLLGIQVDTESDGIRSDDAESGSAGKAPASRLNAPESKPVKNSAEFDLASFEADGGDRQFSHQPIGKVSDKALWLECQSEAVKLYGNDHWQFSHWLYKKLGGKVR